jgi:osmotically-inducible protein OsmY
MEGGMNAELWLSRADDTRPQVDLQRKIWDELRWQPERDTRNVQVSVDAFVATLGGTVPSYRTKIAIQQATERVAGVRTVINDVIVQLPSSEVRDDSTLAAAVANALVWDIRVPHIKLTERVVDGWVTLEGTVSRHAERLAAEQAVENLTGIRGVTNRIAVEPTEPLPSQRRAREAVEHAALRGVRVSVETHDRTVALRGCVHSLAERATAERAVWEVPGVAAVDDLLMVQA